MLLSSLLVIFTPILFTWKDASLSTSSLDSILLLIFDSLLYFCPVSLLGQQNQLGYGSGNPYTQSRPSYAQPKDLSPLYQQSNNDQRYNQPTPLSPSPHAEVPSFGGSRPYLPHPPPVQPTATTYATRRPSAPASSAYNALPAFSTHAGSVHPAYNSRPAVHASIQAATGRVLAIIRLTRSRYD